MRRGLAQHRSCRQPRRWPSMAGAISAWRLRYRAHALGTLAHPDTGLAQDLRAFLGAEMRGSALQDPLMVQGPWARPGQETRHALGADAPGTRERAHVSAPTPAGASTGRLRRQTTRSTPRGELATPLLSVPEIQASPRCCSRTQRLGNARFRPIRLLGAGHALGNFHGGASGVTLRCKGQLVIMLTFRLQLVAFVRLLGFPRFVMHRSGGPPAVPGR